MFILDGLMTPLYLDLVKFHSLRGLAGIFRRGTTGLANGNLNAWINYLPNRNPEEDVLIIQLEIDPSRHMNLFTAWSKGVITKEYVTNLVIPAEDDHKTVETVFLEKRDEILADVQKAMIK